MPSRYSHSQVIDDLARRGLIPASEASYSGYDNLSSHQSAHNQYQHQPHIRSTPQSDQGVARRRSPAVPADSSNQSNRSEHQGIAPVAFGAVPETGIYSGMNVQRQDRDGISDSYGDTRALPERLRDSYNDSPRSSMSVETILHRPASDEADRDNSVEMEYSNYAHQQSSSAREVRAYGGPSPQTSIPRQSSNVSPESPLSSSSDPISYNGSGSGSSGSHPSNSTEPTPLSMHDSSPKMSQPLEYITEDPVESQPRMGAERNVGTGTIADPFSNDAHAPPTKGKGKVTRFAEPERDDSSRAARPSRLRQEYTPQTRSISPLSNKGISQYMRDTRLPRHWDEQRGVRRLDGVETADGIPLSTQNVDGEKIPELEAQEVNDLPTPPEAQEGPGLAASDVDSGVSFDMRRSGDRTRAASPPPPPGHDRNEIRKIAPRSANDGRTIAQEHFTGSKNPITKIKERIETVAQKVTPHPIHHHNNNNIEGPQETIIPEPEVKAAGTLPESKVIGPPKSESVPGRNSRLEQLEKIDSMSPERHHQSPRQSTDSYAYAEKGEMGIPQLESSDPKERAQRFSASDLIDPSLFENKSSQSSIRSQSLFPPHPAVSLPKDRSAPASQIRQPRDSGTGISNAVKRLLPGNGRHSLDSESGSDRRSFESGSSGNALPSDIMGSPARYNSLGPVQKARLSGRDYDTASMQSESSGESAFPPPIRR